MCKLANRAELGRCFGDSQNQIIMFGLFYILPVRTILHEIQVYVPGPIVLKLNRKMLFVVVQRTNIFGHLLLFCV